MAAPRASSLVPDAAWLCAGAAALVAAGAAALLLLADPARHLGAVFLAAGTLGVGCAQLMVTSQTQVCELVGRDPRGGAVFGICSLCDKLSTAAVISLLQRGVQELAAAGEDDGAQATEALGSFYRLAAAGGPVACALLACASLRTVPLRIRDRERSDAPG